MLTANAFERKKWWDKAAHHVEKLWISSDSFLQ